MVFYRKYRPQTIEELDSRKLRETLQAVLSWKDIPHAFLFTGPKGLGKTSTARIIAKILNCTGVKRKGIEPCNVCDQCVSITNGSNIDVLEIDGASNRGIDEIRDLKEKINLAPVGAAKKVYIIDEVHMLTAEAFNALLKTIEEPPKHVVFIFATTEPQKVPATIISRCFHMSLSKATKEEIIHALKRIVEKEKIAVDDDSLDFIAELSDGGYRDATKLLEEVISVAGDKKIDRGFIENYYKTTGIAMTVADILSYVSQHNAVGALHKIGLLVEQGTDIKYFIGQVLSRLHEILLGAVGGEKGSTDLSQFSSVEEMMQLITLFSEAYQQTKYAVIPSLPLELAVVTWCQQENVISSSENEKSQGDLSVSLRDDSKQTGNTPRVVVENKLSIRDAIKKEQNLKVRQVLSGTTGNSVPQKEETYVQENLPQNVRDAQQFMENVIYKVKSYNHSVAGVLRGCHIASIDDTKIIFAAAYPFHKEKLDEPKIRDILEKVVREITGKDLQVMVELKK